MIRTFFRPLFARGGPKLLPVGSTAPAFSVADHQGRVHTLAEYRGRSVCLYFYPKASTPGCTKQGCAFRDRYRELQARGIQVLGISFDTAEENRRFAEAQKFPFPLLCDVDRRVGLAYHACESATDQYPRRITYVIGPDGRIEQAIATQDPGGQAASILEKG